MENGRHIGNQTEQRIAELSTGGTVFDAAGASPIEAHIPHVTSSSQAMERIVEALASEAMLQQALASGALKPRARE